MEVKIKAYKFLILSNRFPIDYDAGMAERTNLFMEFRGAE